MITRISQIEDEVPPRVLRNLKKQAQKERKNLVINVGLKNGLSQDLCKTFYELVVAKPGTVILLKSHDSIDDKINPPARDKISFNKFQKVKGLLRFIKEDYDLPKDKEQELLEKSYLPTRNIKKMLPDKGKKYDEHFPIEDNKLTQPVIAPHSLIQHKKLRESAEHIVYEENPYKPLVHRVTKSPATIESFIVQNFSDKIHNVILDQFRKAMSQLQMLFLRDLEDAEDWLDHKEHTERLTGYKKEVKQGSSRKELHIHKVVDYQVHQISAINQVLKQLSGKNGSYLTAEIENAIENNEIDKAKEYTKVLYSLQALAKIELQNSKNSSESKGWKQVRNWVRTENVKQENTKTGYCIWSSKENPQESYLTVWRTTIELLEECDANVTVNFAESIDEFNPDSAHIETITTNREPETKVYHVNQSFACGRIGSIDSKRWENVERCELLLNKLCFNTGKISYRRFTTGKEMYFGNSKGKDFEGDAWQVVGTPRLSPEGLAEKHLLHYGHFPSSLEYDNGLKIPDDTIKKSGQRTLTGFKDDKLDKIYELYTRREKRDSCLRMRKQREEKKLLIIWGYLPEGVQSIYSDIETFDAGLELVRRLFEIYIEEKEIDSLPEDVAEKMPLNEDLHERTYLRNGLKLKSRCKKKLLKEHVQSNGSLSMKEASEKVGCSTETIRNIVKTSSLSFQPHPYDRRKKHITTMSSAT